MVVGEKDVRGFVSLLRRLKREFILKIGLSYTGKEIDILEVQKLLTKLADVQVRHAFLFALEECKRRYGDVQSAMSVIGMGKLGGEEMGFASDLDLIFLYEKDSETSGKISYLETFTWVARRMIRLLSQYDGGGPGYDIDTRLRPSGSQGLLVCSLAAFKKYHEYQAQSWERQALIRAREIINSHPSFQHTLYSLYKHMLM